MSAKLALPRFRCGPISRRYTQPMQRDRHLSPEAIEIRRATAPDADRLADLAARTFRDTFERDNRPEAMTEHLLRSFGPYQQLAEIMSPSITTFVAGGDEPVAFAQLRRGATPACVTGARPLELWRFYVDRTWHGKGVAGRLMRTVLEEAESSGADKLWLGVWERNPRAIAFYRKFDFAHVGSHEFLFGTELQTDRVLVRELANAKGAARG